MRILKTSCVVLTKWKEQYQNQQNRHPQIKDLIKTCLKNNIMKRIIRLTESDLTRIVKRVIMEERECPCEDGTKSFECCPPKELNPITITANKDANGYKFFLVKPKKR